MTVSALTTVTWCTRLVFISRRFATTSDTYTRMHNPPSTAPPHHRHTSHHAPVWRADENPIRGPVMHADLITIKSSQLRQENLRPHVVADFKRVGGTFLIGRPPSDGSESRRLAKPLLTTAAPAEQLDGARSLWIIIPGGRPHVCPSGRR